MKQDITENNIKSVKDLLSTIDWDLPSHTSNQKDSHNIFIEMFLKIYNQFFARDK